MVNVLVNGVHRDLPEDSTVEDVVALVSRTRSGIAVAVNGAVVVRSTWSSSFVRPGDRVEVLTAAQGG